MSRPNDVVRSRMSIHVNKFGRSTNVDSNVDTDIWDGANPADNQAIWVAPTQARLHNIVSSSVNDAAGGTGARTLRLYGLKSWDDKDGEQSEVIALNGTTPVATLSQWVIVHRMKVLTFGASGPNAGKITATAAVDSTVTAQINAGEGQTQMGIYGVPSTRTGHITRYYASAIKGAASLAVAISLKVAPDPENVPGVFLTKHTQGLTTEGTNALGHHFDPYMQVEGPAIVKLQGNSSANNTDVSGGFDVILNTR